MVQPPFDLNADKKRVKDEYNGNVKREAKYEKKREKDSVYKSRSGAVDSVKRRKVREGDDDRYRRKRDSGWGRDDYDDGDKDWNQDWADNQTSKHSNSQRSRHTFNFSEERDRSL